jgi:hypothetical protein
MEKVSKTINLRVNDSAQALAMMEELEKSDLTVEAEFCTGNLRAVVSGGKEDIRKLESKLLGVLKQELNKPGEKG